jgi:hypothetical protein
MVLILWLAAVLSAFAGAVLLPYMFDGGSYKPTQAVLMMFGFAVLCGWLAIRLTKRRNERYLVALNQPCQQCGSVASVGYRVCSSCGRVRARGL